MSSPFQPAPTHPHAFGPVPHWDTIPQELKDECRWCVWEAVPKPGKPGKFDKVPSNGLHRLSTTKPQTWLTYDEARRLYESMPGRWNGVGLLVERRTGFSYGDVDGTLEIPEGLPATYTEVTPSGNGLRMVWRCPDGAGRDITSPVELYEGHAPRFVTITGLVDGFLGIQAVNGELRAWVKRVAPEPLPGGTGTGTGDSELVYVRELVRNGRVLPGRVLRLAKAGDWGDGEDRSAALVGIIRDIARAGFTPDEVASLLWRMSAVRSFLADHRRKPAKHWPHLCAEVIRALQLTGARAPEAVLLDAGAPTESQGGGLADWAVAGLEGLDAGGGDGGGPGLEEQLASVDELRGLPLSEAVIERIDAMVRLAFDTQGGVGRDALQVRLKRTLKGEISPAFISARFKAEAKRRAALRLAEDRRLETVAKARATLDALGPVGGVAGFSEGDIENPIKFIDAAAIDYPHCEVDEYGFKQNIHPTPQNFRALMDAYGVRIETNTMNMHVETHIEGFVLSSNKRNNHARSYLDVFAMVGGFPIAGVPNALTIVQNEENYHPMLRWLDAQRPWGEDDGFADYIYEVAKCLKVADEHQQSRDMFWLRWVVSGIALWRGWEDEKGRKGMIPKGCLTLAGKQTIGKTSFLRALMPSASMFREGFILDPHNKDSITTYTSYALVEMGEIDSTFKRADIAALKAFIGSSKDVVRQPFERVAETKRRMTLPCASVNHTRFLVDETGNSRFWPIEVLEIDWDRFNQLMAEGSVHRMWVQADAYYERVMDGDLEHRWWMEEEDHKVLEAISREYRIDDPVLELLECKFRWDAPLEAWGWMHSIEIQRFIGIRDMRFASSFHGKVRELLRERSVHKVGYIRAPMVKGVRAEGKGYIMPPMVIDGLPE